MAALTLRLFFFFCSFSDSEEMEGRSWFSRINPRIDIKSVSFSWKRSCGEEEEVIVVGAAVTYDCLGRLLRRESSFRRSA